ncbi:hypothetical protein [Streptomyces sp. NBC_01431]|uniref:hypothetical protein n=1 Tax=Streptomyces sp. NBC_01431 TaxID=2903863 RepID=UPI002E346650|nr:hypothetical protein [Streptomyces sp. NBC_01431]
MAPPERTPLGRDVQRENDEKTTNAYRRDCLTAGNRFRCRDHCFRFGLGKYWHRLPDVMFAAPDDEAAEAAVAGSDDEAAEAAVAGSDDEAAEAAVAGSDDEAAEAAVAGSDDEAAEAALAGSHDDAAEAPGPFSGHATAAGDCDRHLFHRVDGVSYGKSVDGIL